jgi:FHS family L-fucose permease-like MFS transporter
MGAFQIVTLEPSPKWRGQGEVIKKRQFEIHPYKLYFVELRTSIRNTFAKDIFHNSTKNTFFCVMAQISSSRPASVSSQMPQQDYTVALSALTILFFMMGFITCLNDILIPYLKSAFNLNYTQSMLVQLCFFGAYFFMSIPSGILVERLGYKMGMILGFILAGVGCLLFYPAAQARIYELFLFALFVLASGITLLQVAGNPYVAILGKPESSSARLTLTQAFNSLGTTLAPLFGSAVILSMIVKGATEQNLKAVQMPYIGIAITLFLIAILMFFLKLPNIKADHVSQETGLIEMDLPTRRTSAWHYPHLVAGVFGIFCYVGGEVAIGSFLTNYIKEITQLTEEEAGKFLVYYWGGAMVGRFLSAVVLGKFKPAHVLLLNALCVWILVLLGIFGKGWTSIYAFLAVGFFNSLMFPTIFTLAIKDLGKFTNQGAGLLSTAIVGGALVPLLQGFLADATKNTQLSFVVALVCYVYIAWFAWKGYRLGKK